MTNEKFSETDTGKKLIENNKTLIEQMLVKDILDFKAKMDAMYKRSDFHVEPNDFWKKFTAELLRKAISLSCVTMANEGFAAGQDASDCYECDFCDKPEKPIDHMCEKCFREFKEAWVRNGRNQMLEEVKEWAEAYIKERPHRRYSWLRDVVRFCDEKLAAGQISGLVEYCNCGQPKVSLCMNGEIIEAIKSTARKQMLEKVKKIIIKTVPSLKLEAEILEKLAALQTNCTTDRPTRRPADKGHESKVQLTKTQPITVEIGTRKAKSRRTDLKKQGGK
jgi:hypothetical protein